MDTARGYIVRFGVVAWTIQYEDATCRCTATFDVDIESLESNEGPQVLILNPGVLCDGETAEAQATDAAHIELVLQRVQKYLEGAGYVVTRWRG